ncbi:MAG: EAL domain-containing protein [Planctomycetales bacterium]|nr:EAL domain-containing protein [Planctomycetales bacterium]
MPTPNIPDHGTLYLSTVDCAPATTILRTATTAGLTIDQTQDGIATIAITSSQLRRMCLEWSQALSDADQADVRCHLSASDESPSAGTLMHSQSLQRLVRFVEAEWLDQILDGNQLVTYFQPIIVNRSPSEVFAHECLVRGTQASGEIIPPMKLFGAARATDRVAQLDHSSRITAIRTCSERNIGTRIFMNFNPRYLDESHAYLEDTIRTVLETGMDPEQFVFEVVESDEIQDVGRLMSIVEYCREAGCCVALDDMGTGYNSLYLMAAVKPDFIKLDRNLIRDVESDPYKSRVAGKLIELARELGIKSVVEGIETEAALEWSVKQGAEYGQGFLFARPQPEPSKQIHWQGTPAEPSAPGVRS